MEGFMKHIHIPCIVILLTFTPIVVSARKPSSHKRIDKLERYVRDEIYFMHQKLEADAEERDQLMKKLNDTLDYIESLRAQTIAHVGNTPEMSSEETNMVVMEMERNLKVVWDGVMAEKKVRISNTTEIVAKLNKLETNIKGMRIQICSELNCENGGICIRQFERDQCLCQSTYSGPDCSDREEGFDTVTFTVVPESRSLVRGSSHVEECQAKWLQGSSGIEYEWTLNSELIGPYNESTEYGTVPGGLLLFDSFGESMVGNYTCQAMVDSQTNAETKFQYEIIENCPVEIEVGPTDKEKSIGQDVLLECYSSTANHVIWKKEGHTIDFEWRPRFKKMVNNYLRISKLEEQDSGVYRCEARTKSGCYSYRDVQLTVVRKHNLRSICGRTLYDEEVSPRISSGKMARPYDYPWHVIFRAVKGNGATYSTFAGGSLISQKWVLTAAQVIKNFKEVFKHDFGSSSVTLYLGASDCHGTGGVIRRPKRFFVHENYNKSALMDSDIAVIELDSPVEFTDKIRPICLEPSSFNKKVFFDGNNRLSYGKVAGCGWDSRHNQPVNIMEVALPYVSRNDCENMLEELRHNPRYRLASNVMITDNILCAGNDVRRKGDVCIADAGEAFIMHSGNRWVQTGIVSFGVGECDRGLYGLYTNVGQFYHWVRNVTKFDKEEL